MKTLITQALCEIAIENLHKVTGGTADQPPGVALSATVNNKAGLAQAYGACLDNQTMNRTPWLGGEASRVRAGEAARVDCQPILDALNK